MDLFEHMDIVEEFDTGLDGVARLRALIGRKPGIARSLDFEFVEVEAGPAVFAGTPGEHAYNPMGTVHGGYAATLLDSACRCAVHSHLTGTRACTTLSGPQSQASDFYNAARSRRSTVARTANDLPSGAQVGGGCPGASTRPMRPIS